MKKVIYLMIFLLICTTGSNAGQIAFTQEDRERLIRIETTLKLFMEHTNKRFEMMDKRFEDINKRFEDINKRFEDINNRFEDINKRFEDVNKRFEELREDMNKRFDQMIQFLWMMTGIFTTLTAVVIGFAYWDRRTIIKKAKEETIEEIEKEGKVKDLIYALRELAKKDKEVAKILKQFNLL